MYDLMSACYKIVESKPEIFLFSRDKERNRKVFQVSGFRPYFYIPIEEKSEYVTKNEPIFDIKERLVDKLEVQVPGDVKKLRKEFKFTDEADVEFEKRYLADANIYCGFKKENDTLLGTPDLNIPPRVAYADIEVSSPIEIMPRPLNPIYPVVSAMFLDSYTGKKTVFLLENAAKIDDMSFLLNFEEVIYCSSEWRLFDEIAKYIKSNEFDVLTGWFFSNYDFPYFYYRAQKIHYDIRNFSPIREVRVKPHPTRRHQFFVKVGGFEVVDLLAQYKIFTKPEGQKATFDLKYIVSEETRNHYISKNYCRACERADCPNNVRGSLENFSEEVFCQGFTYTDLGDDIVVVHEKDHKSMIRYCFNEVDALLLVDNIRELTKYYDRVRRQRGCFLSDAHRAHKIHSIYLLRLTNKPLPTSRQDIPRSKGRVKGAYVMNPVFGLHENVADIDIHGFYPSILINLNVGAETRSPDGALVAADGTRFKKYPDSLLKRAVKKLTDEHAEYRNMRLNMQPETLEYEYMWTLEQTTKYTVRSFWGTTNYERFCLYDPFCSNAITSTARKILRLLIKHTNSLGYEVVYADTDSVHAKLKTNDWKEGLELVRKLNEFLKTVSEEFNFSEALEVKYEAFFKRAFYQTKKRWVGFCPIRDEKPYNKLIIMGVAAKRSDSAKITIDVQKEFFSAVNIEGNVEKAVQLLKDCVKKFKNLKQADIGIPKGLSKELEEYKHFLWAEAVKWSQENLKFRFRQDRKPKLIYGYIKGKPVPQLTKKKTKAFCIEDKEAPDAVIDWKKMQEITVKKKFEPLLLALGLDWSSVTSETRPSKLEAFF